MSKIVKIFNELIHQKLSSQFGEVLLDCKLIGRNGGIGDYRYDLLFIFDSEYNNPSIQLESVLRTCDELFDWIDLSVSTNLSIVIMHKFGKSRHYSYLELIDELCRRNSYFSFHESMRHPRYKEYQEWKLNKEREERRRRDWETEWGRTERNDSFQQSRIAESRKKKFLFW